MANTFFKIQTVTVGATPVATIDFTSIPQTYTDLKIVISARNNFNAGYASNCSLSFNSSSSNFSSRFATGDGASTASYSRSDNLNAFLVPTPGATASVFGNTEIYIPSYTSAKYKAFSIDCVVENNASGTFLTIYAGLWSNTAAITAISLNDQNGSFIQYSTATLYGIKSS
jgi:hypothetical protein